ncbi:PAM68 family protein [Pseudanabaena sp. FACHB-2040]|uniref:PAM68 family protein n=1 Tax=Pseudanabaena sp. FACHB-2040 TaxID=2692859 RepID=UPI001681E574|nr:PAM68 family protein [Pseudanabaena sp. FACHB-2040]MBD2260438.1 PAM68 family protein [Pseudanabaena sp. FACHB-2040]
MPSDSPRNSLPFEPNRKRKKAAGASEGKSVQNLNKDQRQSAQAQAVQKSAKTSSSTRTSRTARSEASIPEGVSRRMFRRMVIFSGVPTFLGVGVFFLSYFLLINQILDVPKYAVFLTTLGCFGLGVVGLSYGALSASWDEDRLGGWFGASEFKVNFGRLTEAWRTSRKSS